MRRDEENGELDGPEDKMADHALGRDADTIWDMIRDVEVRGPDGANDLCHGRRAGVCLNGMPEQRRDGTGDNGKAREVPAERGADGNGIGDMQASTDHTVQHEGHSTD